MGSVLTSYAKTGDVVKANSLAGFSWASGDGRVFNWHPLLMTFGFVFCSTTAALSYISLPFTRKTNKLIHMTSHGVGAITALVGAIAVFRFHNEHNITNLYSLHSWLGLFTWVCFVTQWIFGLVTYYYPGARPQVRAATISYHIGGGIGILALIYITAGTSRCDCC
jgi:cytochrome b-561